VQGVPQVKPVGLVDADDAAARPQARAVERRDRLRSLNQSQQFIVIEPVGVLRAAAAVGDADNPGVAAVFAVKNPDFVSGDVTVGPAGYLENPVTPSLVTPYSL
jgi:hypothetical protein